MIREALESVAHNESLGAALNRTPIARGVVKRLVAGETVDDALDVAVQLADDGLSVCLERAAPPTASDEAADALVHEYVGLVDLIREAGLADAVELALLAPAFGLGQQDSVAATFTRIAKVTAAAKAAHTQVMLGSADPDDLTTVLEWAADLRSGRDVGVTIPALLRQAESECSRLSDTRVRLVKGGRPGATAASYRQPAEVDKSFVRCAKALLSGTGDVSFATHDPRLVAIIEDLALRFDRPRDSFEFAFYMGRSQATQDRLAENGYRVRVYVPYGPDWFERLVGGFSEQPSSIAAAVRSLLPGRPSMSQEAR